MPPVSKELSRAAVCMFVLGISIIPALSQPLNNDFLNSTGKIYVVVAVLAVIFIAIVGYLIYLDRKIHKLEKQQKHD